MLLCVSASLFSAYAPRKQQAVKWLCSVITVISCLHASGKINLGRKMECGKNILWGKKTFPSSCSREKKSSLLWKLAASFQNCLAIIFFDTAIGSNISEWPEKHLYFLFWANYSVTQICCCQKKRLLQCFYDFLVFDLLTEKNTLTMKQAYFLMYISLCILVFPNSIFFLCSVPKFTKTHENMAHLLKMC